MKNTEEPIQPLSPMAKRYLIVFLISTLFGLALVFLRVAGRRQQLIDQEKAGTMPPNPFQLQPEPTAPPIGTPPPQ